MGLSFVEINRVLGTSSAFARAKDKHYPIGTAKRNRVKLTEPVEQKYPNKYASTAYEKSNHVGREISLHQSRKRRRIGPEEP
eukprot:1156779-Pelagomonas_calceolata.AAC.2